MAFPIFPALAGAVSLWQGAQHNASQRRAAGQSLAQQQDWLQRQLSWYDTMFGNARRLDESGAFDPSAQIRGLEKATAKFEARDLGNLSGALRTAGFRPGDSELGTRLDTVKAKYRDQLDQMRLALQRQSVFDKIGAYNSANPGVLGQGINTLGSNYAMQLGQIQDPTALFGSVMPFLGNRSSKNSPKTDDIAGANSALSPTPHLAAMKGFDFWGQRGLPTSNLSQAPWQLARQNPAGFIMAASAAMPTVGAAALAAKKKKK
jgi:hypothetical protein